METVLIIEEGEMSKVSQVVAKGLGYAWMTWRDFPIQPGFPNKES